MIEATKEDLFTFDELERWVMSCGGYGASIEVPYDVYYLDARDEKAIIKCPMPYTMPNAKIERLQNWCNMWMVVVAYDGYGLNRASSFALWHGMRNIKKLPPVNPYPHKCKTCYSPSRIIGDITMCSNIKCNSKRSLNKFINAFGKNENFVNKIDVDKLSLAELKKAIDNWMIVSGRG